MNDEYQNIKSQAESLRKQEQFDQALPLYEKLWQEHDDKPDEWIGWGYAFCLRKVNRFAEALNICRETWKINPEFERNNSLYGWCIYYTEIKNRQPSLQALLKATNAIVKLTKQGQYSPYEMMIFQVIEQLRKQMTIQWQSVLDWLDKLDPSLLSHEENSFKTSEGKQIVAASPFEKYYAHKTKAYEQLGRHEECIRTSNEALSKLSEFHHDNDVWFARRAALAKGALGNVDEAINDLKRLVVRKPDWFLHHEIAQFQYQLGLIEDALISSATAALAPGPLSFKSELFKLLSQIMEDLNETALAQEHLKLVSLIREDEGWKNDPELEANLERLNVDTEEAESARQVVRSLRPVWEKAIYANQTRLKGTVNKILPHGGAGFIRDENGASHYFDMREVSADTSAINQGVRVQFYIVESFDKSKNQKSTKAIRITLSSD